MSGLGYALLLARSAMAAQAVWPLSLEAIGFGAVANFFDTLGISSFATIMAWLRFRRLVPDALIPPTLVAGCTIPTIVQSSIFLVLLGVKVEPVLLGGCIAAMLTGAWLGARLVIRSPVRLIQAVVGVALLVAGAFFVLTNLKMMPPGGHAAGLPMRLTLVIVAVHFMLGILVNFGVGNYAPTLVLLSLFGMDPKLAFPIMTSAGAFSIAGASVQLVRQETRLDLRLILGLTAGAIPAIFVAAFLIRDLPIDTLRWLVVAVVTFAAFDLLRSALTGRSNARSSAAGG